MNCETARRHLTLYLYQELPPAGEQLLEAHLAGCPLCREELAQEQALVRAMNGVAAGEPPASLLTSCRDELRERLDREPPRSLWKRTQRALLGWTAGIRLSPVPAVALLALGFCAARLWDAATVAAPVLRVRAFDATPQGDLRLVVDEIRSRTLRGGLSDERVRGLLIETAARAQDPLLRARTLDLLKQRPEADDVRRAILAALERDPDAEVRRKAVESLRPFAHQPEARRVLSHALFADDNPAVRNRAIDVLLDNAGAESIGTLQELVIRERDTSIRQRTVQALRELRASIEPF